MSAVRALRDFLAAHSAAALVEVTEAKGSTPREAGAWMLVSPDAIFGTIGGGQLEFLAIAEARRVLDAQLRGVIRERRPREDAAAQAASSTTLRVVPLPRFAGEDQAAATPGSSPIHGGGGPREAWRRGPEGKSRATRGESHAPLRNATTLDIPLGPEIGQCCGGWVALAISPVDDPLRGKLLARAAAEDAARPHVRLFGAGHVGHALARALALLPVNVAVVETRAETLAGLPQAVEAKLLPLPEQAIRAAPPGSAFVILTHDHALDFLLTAESLKREDAAYVGMIGSKTKRSTFRSWFLKEAEGTGAQLEKLVCPIGGAVVRDKRPAVIAALAAAEIVTALAVRPPFSGKPALP